MTDHLHLMRAWKRLSLGLVLLITLLPGPGNAYDGRYLAKEDIILYGMQLTAAPAKQTVPKNIATIVSTFLQVPTLPAGQVPPLPPDATVKGTLRGPGLETPLELSVAANSPFNIPALTVPGTYTLDGIRLEAGGEVLFYATPESVKIEVIEKLLVTQITARPLTADEIRSKGIVFDSSNFQAYNFTAAFAVAPGKEINISMPVVLPKLQGTKDVIVDGVAIPQIRGAQITTLSTIIPDSLRLAQTAIPNLTVQSFTLKPQIPEANNFYLPPIAGVVAIPGDIGFLNQYFSVMLMVGNVAPADSNLVVKDLRAEMILPTGIDNVVGTSDDPLAMANTDRGASPRIQAVSKPGLDGKIGTGDDVNELAPGDTGNAEFLVEGRREGSHTVEMEITGTLYGLPIGPVPVRGRAMGTVLVRNPNFTMTFTHPDIVNAGEKYNLDVTVTNTSDSPANFVSVNLFPSYISGARLVGDPVRSIDYIAPGDSASISYELIAQVTGNVFAATLDSDEHIKGKFLLKTSVGELGIPLSPDSLVLPKESRNLPEELRQAVLGLLGKAYATATAPAAALPPDVLRFGKKIVWDRGIEAAEAGFRYALHETLPATASQLLMDYIGSNYQRIDLIYASQNERDAARSDFAAFDDLRRRSVRGDTFAAAVGHLLNPELADKGAAVFHRDLAARLSYRPRFFSVLATGDGGPAPVTATLVDANGKRVGGMDAKGKVVKEIPFADYVLIGSGSGSVNGQLAILSDPQAGPLTLRVSAIEGSPTASYTLSIVYPDASGTLHHLSWSGLAPGQVPQFAPAANDPVQLSLWGSSGVAATAVGASDEVIPDGAPQVLSVVQQPQADVFKCDAKDAGRPLGRVVAVLFDREVTAASAQDKVSPELITNWSAEENKVVGVALQPDRRIAFVGLRDPLGPFIPRTMTVANVADDRGHVSDSQTLPMEATIEAAAGVVSGKIMQADGNLVPGAEVRLILQTECPETEGLIDVGISAKNADQNGHYQWDYVGGSAAGWRVKEVAQDPNTNDVRRLLFSISRNGQRLNADIVFLGRGTVQGRVFAQDGVTPLKDVKIKVTSLVDQTEYGGTSDADGRYLIPRVPIGNSLVEAVHVETNAHVAQSTYIGNAGEVVNLDLVLMTQEVAQIKVKYGALSGVVLRPDGATPVSGVPAIAFYQNNSQSGVYCPGAEPPPECAVALTKTDSGGGYAFPTIPAGSYRIYSFDQAVYQQGNIHLVVPADGAVKGNILLNGGFGTVRGTVLDADGNPVAGALVGGGLVIATTDDTGAFELKDVPLGHAMLVAVSQALGATGRAEVDIIANGEIVNATIVLSAMGGVYGTVFTADGVTPAAGLDVFALKRDPGSGLLTIVGSTATDGQGKYQIKPVPVDTQNEYVISAFLPDLSDGNIAKTKVLFAGHQAKAEVTFKGKGKVNGVIYDDDGQTPLKARVSVSGLTVQSARGPGGKPVGLGFVHTQHIKIIDTDFTTGKFSFDNVFVGQFVITAGGAFSPDPVTLAETIDQDGQVKDVVLKLTPTSVVTGKVYQPDGYTPVGEAVKVTFKSDESRTFCSVNQTTGEDKCTTIPQGVQEEIVYTQADGSFKVPIVNAGQFTLTALDQVTGKTSRIKGSVAAGQTADVQMRLMGKADVVVQVFSSDGVTPIAGARVDLTGGDFPNPTGTGTAVDGTITFGGIDEGTFVVFAQDLTRGFSARKSAKVEKDGQTVTVKVYLYDATGVVYGTVYRPDGVTPVPNADVAIFQGANALAFNTTDANGQYRQDTIPLGGVSVKVFEAATGRRGGGSGNVDLAGQEVPINVDEAAIGHVKGVVYDAATMAPLRGWSVRLSVSFPDGSSISLIGTTGTDGSYFFPGIPQGAFTVTASREGLGSATAQGVITREGELIDLPLVVSMLKASLGSIQGMVFNPDGSPAPNYSICIDPTETGCVFNATSQADGTFLVDSVPLGRHTVIASSQVTASTGTALADLAFAGDATVVKVVVDGLGTVSPTVVWQDDTPAAGVQVVLEKAPNAGCGAASCQRYVDALGNASFTAVPPGSYTVWAIDPVHGLSGAASGVLNVGDNAQVRLVLEVNGTVTGTALYPDQKPRSGIIAALAGTTSDGKSAVHYTATDADGVFSLKGVKRGTYTLNLTDPLGTGMGRRYLTVDGVEDLGTVILDDAPPQVATIAPVPGALKVPLEQKVVITFSEPVQPGSVNATSVTLSDGTGAVTGTITLADGNTTATFTPIAPLKEQTVYTVKVNGVTDNLERPMAKPFVASFTTVDLTPPAIATVDPAPATSGFPLEGVVRITYNEPIDTAAFTGAAIAVTRGGAPVAGRVDYVFGNTGMVFTPTYPFLEGGLYQVEVQPSTDLSGNRQAAGLTFNFSAQDRTPPVISQITPSNGGSVIEGANGSVTVNVGGASDVAFVDFMVNGAIVATDRNATDGFTLQFLSAASLGKPGDIIKVSAVATDTSGNRGTAVDTFFTIVADTPPAVAITQPAAGSAFKTGERVNLTVTAGDDVGVSLIGYQAVGGVPPAAATSEVTPAATAATKSFAFYVPVDAVPGSTITLNATAVDTRGQMTKATPVLLTVLDATAPQVSFTSPVTGAKVNPGQQVSAVVQAADLGGVAKLEFRVSGGTVASEDRVIDPALNAVATTFSFNVAPSATPADTINLDVAAVDKAGNRASAGQVKLVVADTHPPVVTLKTANGSSDMIPGQQLSIIVQANDDVGVKQINLTGSGAFTYDNAQGISPPLGNAQASFTVMVPANLSDGATFNLQATAVDLSNNVSAPVLLTLRAQSLPSVTLPSSTVLNAGDQKPVDLQLSAPAPSAGIVVSVSTGNAAVATVTQTVIFAAGEQVKPITLNAIAGGSTQLTATIAGVVRGSMTVTVNGGIVTGTVYNPYPNPVAGAEVVVNGYSVTTDATGRFSLTGIGGPGVTFRAYDPVTKLKGYLSASMNAAGGYLKNVQIQLVPAAALSGTVFKADGTTPAGSGAQVVVYRTGDLSNPLDTVFTDANGHYEFPLLQIGSYVMDASTGAGEKGRGSAAIVQSGLDVTANITFLGKGTVAGTVVDGAGAPVANPTVKLNSYSLFGSEQRQVNGLGDGSFSIADIFVGTFSVTATDPITKMSAGASGSVASNNQTVSLNLRLASVASITGHVYRNDGVTPVSGATVSAGNATTTTDSQGSYFLETLPLGIYTVTADDKGARARIQASVTLSTHGQVKTQDLVLPGSGSVVVNVSYAGSPLSGASVVLHDGYGSATVGSSGGVAVFNEVQAGNFTVNAYYGASATSGSGTVAAGDTATVNLTLPTVSVPAGSIGGTVYLPDGKTPAAKVTVRTQRYSTVTGDDGIYLFDKLTFDTYDLTFSDATGMIRARANDIVINQDGQAVTRDATLVGLGSVAGRVLMPDSSSAGSMSVSVRSLNADFGRTATAITDAAGYYLVQRLPVGQFTVSAGDASRQLLGEGAGTINGDGDTATADIVLQNNAFTPPRTLKDGNLYSYDIQRDATIRNGQAGVFTNATNLGASALELVSGSTVVPFAGDAIATLENQSRELDLRQLNIFGLNVTRKVFVPADGYFARYLDVLSNPTQAPVSVDVRVKTRFGAAAAAVYTTSSGDAAIQVTDPATRDNWAVVDNGGANPPSVALIWGGDGAVAPTSAPFSAGSGTTPASVTTTWNSVTVPAGGTVAILHFVAQGIDRNGAQEGARRLVQLPPEALSGLTGEELSAIANFTAPADGSSALAALPPLTGEITGQVLASDGLTPAPAGTPVTLTSDLAMFAKSFQKSTDGSGIFRFTSDLFSASPTMGIPLTGFTLKSRVNPGAAFDSLPVAGSFGAGASSTTKNVVFANSGILSGSVSLSGGQPLAGASLKIASGAYGGSLATGSDGSFRFAFLPAGSYSITVEKTSPQGSNAVLADSAVIGAGSQTDKLLSFPPLTTVTALVKKSDGTPESGVTVKLTAGSFTRSAGTDSTGTAVFFEVPAGSYTATATEPGSGLIATLPVTVADSALSFNLAFPANGRITGSVFFADGVTPVSGVTVEIFDATTAALLKTVTSGTTFDSGVIVSDATGFRVRGTYTYATARGNLTATGEQVIGGFGGSNIILPAKVTLPVNRTTLQARVFLPDGTRYLGESVAIEARAADSTLLATCTTSSASGECSMSNLVAGSEPLSVRAVSGAATLAQTSVMVTASGATTTADLTIPVTAAVLPASLYDGNGALYKVEADGRLSGGVNNLFTGGDTGTGGSVLEIVSGGSAVRFAGAAASLTSAGNGREISLRQDSLAGLTVIRRVAVPADGYFVRYLDTLINSGASPVTVDVNLRSQLAAAASAPAPVTTSNGDAALAPAADLWASFDDAVTDDPFVTTTGNLPPFAQVWQGASSPLRLSTLSYASGEVVAGFGSVTVPAGASVAILHFTTQQASRTGAQASAERLSQLPPEVLASLSSADRSAIKNFTVPGSGPGTVTALPAVDGTVTGTIVATDGVTLAPAGTPVSFRSANAYFGRTYQGTTDAAGAYTFATALDQGAATVGIVRDSYTVDATVTIGGVTVPASASGDFANGAASTRDVYFNIVPKITTVSPATIFANQSPLTITLTGSNFGASSQVLLNGGPITTTYVSATSLQATVPMQTSAGAVQVTVRNPDPIHPGGYVTSPATTLTVVLPQFSLTPNPLGIRQKGSGTLTITIPFPAPAGGVTANLTSTDTATATVPATVTIPAGSASTTFDVSAPDTTVNRDVTLQVHADQNNWLGTATSVTVRPEPTVNITPTSVLSGQGFSFFLTVNLTDPAPTGGLVVALSASTANVVSFPASVTIAAGANQAQLTVSNTGTGSTIITATPAAGSGFSAGDACAVTVKPVQTYNIGPTLSVPVGVQVATPAPPSTANRTYGPLVSRAVGVVVGPILTGLTPQHLPVGSQNQTVRILGKGLNAVSSVAFSPATGITVHPETLNLDPDGSYAEVTIDIATDAPVGNRVIVVKAGSAAIPSADPDATLFQVTYPTAQVWSLVPNSAAAGSAFTFQVNGRNLYQTSAVTFTPADGISVGTNISVSADGTLVSVPITINAAAPLGARVVTITTPAGTTSAVATFADTFTVYTTLGPQYTPVTAPQVGVLVQTAAPTTRQATYGPAFSNRVGVAVGPVLTGIVPATGAIGTNNMTIRLTGNNLGQATSLAFNPATGITINPGLNVAADGSYVEAVISIASDAPLTPRTAILQTATGPALPAGPGANQFRVTLPQPLLYGIIPTRGQVGTNITLTLSGTLLSGATQVAFIPPDGITVANPPTVDSTGNIATVGIQIAAGASVGSRTVTITTPGGTTTTTPSAANSFQVTSDAGFTYTPLVSRSVGVTVATAPPATTAPRTYTPVLSVPVGVTVPAPPPLNASLVGYWNLDGDFKDSSGNGLNGTAVNGATFNADKIMGTASGSFGGSNDYVSVGNLYGRFPNNTFAVEAWVKFNDTGAGARRIFAGGTGAYADYGIGIMNNQFMAVAANHSNSTVTYATSGITAVAGTWYHVVGTYDGTQLKVYVDGTLAGGTVAQWVQNNGSVDFWIGGEYCCSNENFNGLIDEVALYNRALTSDEVLKRYQGQGLTSTLPASSVTVYGPVVATPVGVTVGPMVKSMTPNRLEPGKTVTVTFTGIGLDAVTSIMVGAANGVTAGTPTASSDGTTLTVDVTADPTATRGSRSLIPIYSGGGVSAPIGGTVFYVGARPVVASISPILQTVGNTFTLTINGTSLDAATTVRFEPPDGITVMNPPTINAAGTQATVTVIIDGTAPGGQRVVVVDGPFGPSDSTSGANNTFNVSRPVGAAAPETAAPEGPAPEVFAALVADYPGGWELSVRDLSMAGLPVWRQPLGAPPATSPIPEGEKRDERRYPVRSEEVAVAAVSLPIRSYRGPPAWNPEA